MIFACKSNQCNVSVVVDKLMHCMIVGMLPSGIFLSFYLLFICLIAVCKNNGPPGKNPTEKRGVRTGVWRLPSASRRQTSPIELVQRAQQATARVFEDMNMTAWWMQTHSTADVVDPGATSGALCIAPCKVYDCLLHRLCPSVIRGPKHKHW